jgi:hypothetical protein
MGLYRIETYAKYMNETSTKKDATNHSRDEDIQEAVVVVAAEEET